ncbi:MAG: amidase [Chloroflexi bacterium]|nr:amidase [Chloroflexota bacterium]
MTARDSFRAALADTQRYRVDAMMRRPAFTYSLERYASDASQKIKSLPAGPRRAPSLGTVAGAAEAMAQGRLSATELLNEAIGVIKAKNSSLNAFTFLAPEEELLREAKRLDSERARGRVRGAFHGIPASVKDVLHVRSMPTTASSRVMHVTPAADATAVGRLRDGGALLVGKTHTHEFALGVTTPQSHNPWDPARDPGGPSGGSAIAVATGMSLVSLGTDTRASIRVPSALCGIVGYKPTYGLVSTDGIVVLSWSMDHTGLMGRTVRDTALLMNAAQGPDIRDPNTVNRPPDNYTLYLDKDVRGLRVGLALHGLTGADPAVLAAFDQAVEALRAAGAQIIETSTPSAQDIRLCTSLGMVMSRCEAAAFHQAFPDAANLYTEPVREQLDEARHVTAVDYLAAQRFRSEFAERMAAHFQEFDALLLPTSKVPAPALGESDRFIMILSENCIPWSFIGFPALSVPCGSTPSGLPVGAQLVGAPFNDGAVLALASAVESALGVRFP